MQERRAIPRRRTLLNGVLLFQSGNASLDCRVRDLSEAGAQIELPSPMALDAFELLAPGKNLRAQAQTVWRSGLRMGVRLGPAHAQARKTPALRDDVY